MALIEIEVAGCRACLRAKQATGAFGRFGRLLTKRRIAEEVGTCRFGRAACQSLLTNRRDTKKTRLACGRLLENGRATKKEKPHWFGHLCLLSIIIYAPLRKATRSRARLKIVYSYVKLHFLKSL